MTQSDLEALTSRIRTSIDCSRELARDYAAAIGDTPEIQGGQVLVRNEEGRVIARVPRKVVEGGG